jgi:hypothetical protein
MVSTSFDVDQIAFGSGQCSTLTCTLNDGGNRITARSCWPHFHADQLKAAILSRARPVWQDVEQDPRICIDVPQGWMK